MKEVDFKMNLNKKNILRILGFMILYDILKYFIMNEYGPLMSLAYDTLNILYVM